MGNTIKIGDHEVSLERSEKFLAIRASIPSDDLKDSLLTLGLPQNIDPKQIGKFVLLDADDFGKSVASLKSELKQKAYVDYVSDVIYTSPDMVPFIPTGSFYIKFKGQATEQEKAQLLSQYHLGKDDGDPLNTENDFLLTDLSLDPLFIAGQLQESALVETAEPDFATEFSIG